MYIENNTLRGAYEPQQKDPQIAKIIVDIFDKYPNHVAQVIQFKQALNYT